MTGLIFPGIGPALVVPPPIVAASNPVLVSNKKAAEESTSATTLTIAKPDSLAEGDLMLAIICIGNGSVTTTDWDGFTQINGVTQGNVTIAMGWKIATGSEPASYTFEWSGAQRQSGIIARITGAHATTPIGTTEDVDYSRNGSSSSSAVSDSLTPPVSSGLLVGATAVRGPSSGAGYTAGNNPSEMTEFDVASTVSAFGVDMGAAWENRSDTSAVGTRTWTLDSSDNWANMMALIRPAA